MSKSYLIKPPLTIFKEYDIRNQIGEDLNENTYYTLGVAIGSELQELHGLHTLLLCRDSRPSSKLFADALIKGLLFTGTNVIDIGCLPTPVLYFAMHDLQCQSGLMVTASHNPADYNGLKIILGKKNYYGERLRLLHQRIMDERYLYDDTERGRVVQYPEEQVVNKYIRMVKASLRVIKPLKVVIGGGNGVACHLAPQLLTALGCQVISHYAEQSASSAEENLSGLRRVVQSQQAHLGLAFDGDGDRLSVIDKNGCVIPSDYLLLAFADALLKKMAEPAIVFDVKCTHHLQDYLSAHNGRAIMTKTGMAHIMATMSAHQAAIGGEYCGHFYFSDRWLPHDDGLYAAARVLEMLSEQAKDSHQFFEQFPKSLSTDELKVGIAEGLKAQFMQQVVLQAPDYLSGELVHIDGLRANLNNAWGLIRPSNTGPYLTIRFEAKTYEAMQDIKWMFGKLINAINPLLALPF
ncbi:phosphomannomutase/phosphoglucomutase [Legionella saoudiensis]|uniref:phosphomannomutase/phosphoglucomutase n=1 Tax=Legionella saoudiensis TaxID=1750561 RepID=UPI0007315A60|nr:phosphomannomutase/phosphoglucomutase [Legionella saoudiensis]